MSDFNISVDFLQGTVKFPGVEFSSFVKQIEDTFKTKFAILDHGRFVGRWFANQASSHNGVILLWNTELTDDSKEFDHRKLSECQLTFDVWLSVPGSPLAELGTQQQLAFLYGLHNWGFCPTRFDVAIDDHRSNALRPAALLEILENQDVLFLVRGYQFMTGKSNKQGRWVSSGDTLYFGSRTSSKRIRVYETRHCHDFDAVRWETQLRDAHAKAIFARIFRDIDAHPAPPTSWDENELVPIFNKALASALLSSVDFREKTQTNRDRCPVCPFWQEIIDGLDAYSERFSLPRDRSSIPKKLDWLRRQVSQTLVVLRRGFSPQFLRDFLNSIQASVEEHLSSESLALIDVCRKYDKGFVYQLPA